MIGDLATAQSGSHYYLVDHEDGGFVTDITDGCCRLRSVPLAHENSFLCMVTMERIIV